MAPTCGLSREHEAPVTGELVPSLYLATAENCCVEAAPFSDWMVTDPGVMDSPVTVRLLMMLESPPSSPKTEESSLPASAAPLSAPGGLNVLPLPPDPQATAETEATSAAVTAYGCALGGNLPCERPHARP